MTIDPTVEAEPIDSLERKRSLEAAIRTRREAVLVVNSRSRRGRQLYRRAKRLLRERGIALSGVATARSARLWNSSHIAA